MGKVYPMLLTKQQMDRLMFQIEKTDEFDYMFFLTLKNTGRRIGELYGLQDKKVIKEVVVGQKQIVYKRRRVIIDVTRKVYSRLPSWKYGVKVKDIDFNEGTMTVWVLKRKQYIREKSILTPELLRIIHAYVKKNKLNLESHLFRKPGRSLRGIQSKLKTYARKSGIKTTDEIDGVKYSFSPHSFRHFFITFMKLKGLGDDVIIKFTGHKSTDTLRNYDHVVATDLKEKFLEIVKDL